MIPLLFEPAIIFVIVISYVVRWNSKKGLYLKLDDTENHNRNVN